MGLLSYSEAHNFLQQVVGKTIQLDSWQAYQLSVLSGDVDARTISGELYYDNSFLRLESYPMHGGLDVDADIYWIITSSAKSPEAVEEVKEVPEWKVWSNLSDDIRARQEELMSNLRKRRGG